MAFQWSHDMKHKKRKSGENRISAGFTKTLFGPLKDLFIVQLVKCLQWRRHDVY